MYFSSLSVLSLVESSQIRKACIAESGNHTTTTPAILKKWPSSSQLSTLKTSDFVCTQHPLTIRAPNSRPSTFLSSAGTCKTAEPNNIPMAAPASREDGNKRQTQNDPNTSRLGPFSETSLFPSDSPKTYEGEGVVAESAELSVASIYQKHLADELQDERPQPAPSNTSTTHHVQSSPFDADASQVGLQDGLDGASDSKPCQRSLSGNNGSVQEHHQVLEVQDLQLQFEEISKEYGNDWHHAEPAPPPPENEHHRPEGISAAIEKLRHDIDRLKSSKSPDRVPTEDYNILLKKHEKLQVNHEELMETNQELLDSSCVLSHAFEAFRQRIPEPGGARDDIEQLQQAVRILARSNITLGDLNQDLEIYRAIVIWSGLAVIGLILLAFSYILARGIVSLLY
ncbi:hypothetical protein BJ508DRAFT_380373 [Ascobolus immersus RN42]|uniref:Uncharacterized protein n=1 Tax=Ascobolus immersus RN42 TaxID=1160509 RepID=A0A3N4HNH4_ASCIM|nr:hypothetical protein BJ508DRAFT_380373 [Ascobolus immersus RN42]